MRIVAIIPARIGSKRIPKKNLKKVGDKTLVEHALHAAVKCLHIDKVILYVDSLELVPKPFTKYDTLERFATDQGPKRVYVIEDRFASDAMKLDANIQGLVSYLMSYDYVVLLQPTSPLRTTLDISSALYQITSERADSLVSITLDRRFIWLSNAPLYDPVDRPRSQCVPYRRLENGAIYIYRPWVLRQLGSRIGGKTTLFVMSNNNSFEIDEPEDLELVRAIYEYQDRK